MPPTGSSRATPPPGSRFPVSDEVARVGRAFNSMVDRMADSVKALEAARDRLVQPAEAMSEGFALWDADDRLVLYNSKFGDMFEGVRDRLVLGKTFEEVSTLLHEHVLALEDRPPLAEWLAGRATQHCRTLGPREKRLRDGRWMSTREFRTPDGGTVGIYTDITEAKERQRALEHGEQRMRAVMNSVIDGILTLADDGSGRIGQPGRREDLRLRSVRHDRDRRRRAAGARRPGSTARPASMLAVADFTNLPGQTLLEMVGVRRDGATFPIELSVTSINLHGRRTFIAAVRDITARKAAEEAGALPRHPRHSHRSAQSRPVPRSPDDRAPPCAREPATCWRCCFSISIASR